MTEIIANEPAEKSKIISFVGGDKYELERYLAELLCQLGYKVLLIDLSESKALSEALYDTEGVGCEITIPCILEHKGIDFIPRFEDWQLYSEFINPYLYQMKHEYDYVIVDFGFLIGHSALARSSLLFLVTDMQKHNVSRIRLLLTGLLLPKIIVIQDIVPCKIRAKDLFLENIDEAKNQIHYLDYDMNDKCTRLLLQYTRTLNLKKVSKKVREVLYQALQVLIPEITKKGFEQVVSLKRGGSRR
jgi:cellulose biosynthesis protein BcsQ